MPKNERPCKRRRARIFVLESAVDEKTAENRSFRARGNDSALVRLAGDAFALSPKIGDKERQAGGMSPIIGD